ncbi:MAG TPA: NAD(P)/FAD-dependent oxidoreductase [Solirubrobacteraceae bacterium]|nr:NAD(P)/FAD-dependent oxidoreductase [Solirubrobacteraceae bacterium]
MSAAAEHHHIVIIGSGFSGLGAAIRFKQEGIHDFVVLERAEDVGGTWRDNTYPGCACDVPSHLYSFSFAPNPKWSRTFSKQPEIWEYLRRCSREHGVEQHVRYRHEVTAANWDEQAQRWLLDTTAGNFSADIVIAAAGPLSDPKLPDIDGIESFQGKIFHSARWDHEHALDGERVAVIGTGASSIQLVPRIQPQVQQLDLYQRTPPWVTRHRDRPISRREQLLYRLFPPAQLAMRAAIYWARELFVIGFMHPREGTLGERMALGHLHAQVKDPELREQLTPRYRLGCKRVLISNEYYPALTQPNVEVVTDGISAIKPHAIVTSAGEERPVDTIILGTGFHVTDQPIAQWVRGRDGRSLADTWKSSPQAYLGASIAGFPNLFMLVGPNTGLGHNSIVFMIESQLNHLLECLRFMKRSATDVVEVRETTQKLYNQRVQRELEGSVWNSGGCASWYIDDTGKNTTIWPGFTWPFRKRTRDFAPDDYHLRTRTSTDGSPPSTPAQAALVS